MKAIGVNRVTLVVIVVLRRKGGAGGGVGEVVIVKLQTRSD